jgi:hypothetical protein
MIHVHCHQLLIMDGKAALSGMQYNAKLFFMWPPTHMEKKQSTHLV